MITKPTIYTDEFVLNEVTQMLEKVYSDESIMFWQQLLRDKSYTRERVWEWKKLKNLKNKEISNVLKKIHEEFEYRLTVSGFHLKNPAMPIFILKNHYGMKDKIETEENVNMRVYRAKLEVSKDVEKLPGSETDVKLD